MKTLDTKKIILLIGVFLLAVNTSFAQTWENYFAESEKAYHDGKYRKALSKSESARKKSEKTENTPDVYIAWLSILDAKYLEALGDYSTIEKKIEKGISILSMDKDSNFEAYVMANCRAADVYIEYGNYRKAKELIEGVNKEVKEKKLAQNSLAIMEVEHRLATVYAQVGKLNESLAILKNTTPLWKDSFNRKNGQTAPTKYDTEYREEQYAKLLTLFGVVLTKKGEYLKAHEWLYDKQAEVKSMAGRGNTYADHLMAMGDNHYDGEAYKEADKYYIKAQSSAKKGSKTYTRAYEKIIRTYIKRDKFQLAQGKLDILKRTISAKTKGENIYQITAKLLEAEILSGQEKHKNADEKFNDVLRTSKSIMPTNHELRAEAAEKFYESRTDRTYRLKNAKKNLLFSMKIKKELYGEESTLYQKKRVELANFNIDFTDALSEAKEIYDTEPHKIILAELSPIHKDYASVLAQVAKYYDITDDYDKSIAIFQQSIQASKERYGEKSTEVGKLLSALADVEIKAGSYGKAEEHINTMLEILGEKAPEAAASARLYAALGEYERAEQAFRKAAKREETAKQDRAFLYVQTGQFVKARELLVEILDESTATFGKKSKLLVSPLNELAKIELAMGNYPEAEEHAKHASELAESIFTTNSIKFAESTALLSKIYFGIGDYQKANASAEKVIEILTQILNSQHTKVAQALTEYALIKFKQDPNNTFSEVEFLLKDAQKVILANFDKTHPLYAQNLTHLALLYISQAKTDQDLNQPFVDLNMADKIWTEKFGDRNLHSANISALMGDVYSKVKMFKEAKRKYEKAEYIYEKLFSETHPDYVHTLSRLGRMYYVHGDYKKADQKVDQAMSTYLNYIEKYFPALSEKEKSKYWKKIRGDFEFYNSLAIKRWEEKPKTLGNMYDFSLATKALLLNSSSRMKDKIGTNKKFGRLYKKWVTTKEYLAQMLGKSTEQLARNQISIPEIEAEVEDIEKQMSKFPDLFSHSEVFTWEDVRGTLEKNEAAIEIIQYRQYENGFTDQSKYAALIVTRNTKSAPKLVLFENGNELETKYLKYYFNATDFKLKDIYSYKQFWKPIADMLGEEIEKVYVSVDGVYNQVNVEAMRIEDETFVIDKMQVSLVSNTKDLIIKKREYEAMSKKERRAEAERNRVAFIMANPSFYSSSKIAQTALSTQKRGENRSAYINPLPGTKIEAEAIKKFFDLENWDTKQYYLGGAAKENIIKTFSKRARSPRLMHIATHGFFNKEIEIKESVFEQNSDDLLKHNPLLQSGLLLSNAGDLLAKHANSDAVLIGDGILTAYEVMNLNLGDTELVILSACETGRGDIQSGEGVFGLQRAFLVAGADAIVMSLFKVPDVETAELMSLFYQKWLLVGKDKRQAFREAQIQMKNKYSDPIYWGAFNMIGID
jgi:CHAT domain-containing protein